jgi:hypothetical protein
MKGQMLPTISILYSTASKKYQLRSKSRGGISWSQGEMTLRYKKVASSLYRELHRFGNLSSKDLNPQPNSLDSPTWYLFNSRANFNSSTMNEWNMIERLSISFWLQRVLARKMTPSRHLITPRKTKRRVEFCRRWRWFRKWRRPSKQCDNASRKKLRSLTN